MVNTLVAKKNAFQISRRDCVLTFPSGHEFEGLEIKAKLDVNIGIFFEMQSMSQSSNSEEIQLVFNKFGDDVLISWNIIDDDGSEVDCSGKGFMTLPPSIAFSIITAWAEEASIGGKV